MRSVEVTVHFNKRMLKDLKKFHTKHVIKPAKRTRLNIVPSFSTQIGKVHMPTKVLDDLMVSEAKKITNDPADVGAYNMLNVESVYGFTNEAVYRVEGNCYKRLFYKTEVFKAFQNWRYYFIYGQYDRALVIPKKAITEEESKQFIEELFF